jgi:NitT/TauT family transport system ATP-binding protein
VTAAGASLLEVRGVCFSYPNGPAVLEDIDLTLEPGELLGIVGPSGSGKSTLLRLIADLDDPSSGTVQVHAPRGRHPVSLLFQQDTLLPWKTVAQNVEFYYSLHRSLRGNAARRRCAELLAMVGLANSAGTYPHQLSGGMRRRVALLAAVAANPALLLLDEPFSSVDEPTRIAIHQELLAILRENGTSLVLVTHDLNEAISLCGRVAVVSSRPARIASIYDTTSVGDRSDLLALRSRPEYLSLYARIWAELSDHIRASSAPLTESIS